ncbi:tetratricopeptide repeat protein [Lentilactobacillus sp. Marseille-Q4993]|uniref:tetratricopeptide repeat protein n=1 Tax=Lentilactobacillus sp. Marseille-Q4993 TaxID=3039492 RepID=UPI0024BC0BA2|nr:tetratricopeptide repeat protein [Lentilactobacillus sp. Marseille-Q4993]
MTEREKEEQKAKQLVHELVVKIDQDPDNYRNYYELATLLVEGKDYPQAEELLMKALGRFATAEIQIVDLLRYGLGNVYYAAEEFDKAIAEFQKVTDKGLQFQSYLMLAQSYMAKGDSKRSLAFAISAQEKNRKDKTVNQLIGDNLLALGNFTQAGEFYDMVLEIDSKDGKANFNRGIVAMINDENFSDYFDKAKKYDQNYFNDGQERLKDIEKFIQLNKKKQE